MTAEIEDHPAPIPEVKTLTFATLRTFGPQFFGSARFDRLRGQLQAEARAVLDTAEPGAWVAEATMLQVMSAIHRDLLRGDDDAFLDFARALAREGISRFMRIFLSLASARFVLRRVPVVWDRLRRNAGTVVTEVEGDEVRIKYAGFPFFFEPCYRLLSLANCQALVQAAVDSIPKGRIESFGYDQLELSFDLTETATH